MAQNKFFTLEDGDKDKLKKAYKEFAEFEEQIVELKESQREVVSKVAKEVQGVNKKDIKKIFNFLKRSITPEEVRGIADVMEEVNS
jgi:DNA-directed RNA polymerase subunit F